MSAVRIAPLAVLLIGPTVLAFFAGGYFEVPRLVAGIVAWSLVAVAAARGQLRFPPRGRGARLALAGLIALVGWSAASMAWTALPEPALADVQRLLLYLGGTVAAVAILNSRQAHRAVEPVVAAGAFIVIADGLSERLLPGVVTLSHSLSAAGRLEQPLTYWNAMGALAALGLVACTRIAGDDTRPDLVRALAAAACVTLGLGLYLTFSRGAIAALASGLLVLAALSPTRRQLRAVALTVASVALAAAATAVLPALRRVDVPAPHRTAEGLAMLALLVLLALAATRVMLCVSRAERDGRLEAGPVSIRRPKLLAAACAAALLGAILVGGLVDRRPPATGATAARLSSAGSNRYEYWRVALLAFSHQPLRGTGTAGFQAAWVRDRHIRDQIADAHSLYLETLAELGIVGAALLAAFLGGVVLSARQAIRRDAALATGLVAVFTVWAVHAALDWDWEMPAVTLVGLLAAAALISQAAPDGPGLR